MRLYVVKSVDKVQDWKRVNGAWRYRESHSANIAAYTSRAKAEEGCKYLNRLEARVKLGYMYDDSFDRYFLITVHRVEEVNIIE